jgi:probable phosphoglycerate mutase
MTDLYLIRHAQAIEDASGAPTPSAAGACGNRDAGTTVAALSASPRAPAPEAPLSPLGILQAERLRSRLAATHEIKADALIASPLRRTRETAEIIALALGLPVTLDADFKEFDLGDGAGVPEEEIASRFGVVDFEREPHRPVAPGGDTWAGFTERGCGAFERVTQTYAGKTIVIVTHDGVVALSFLYCFGLPSLKFVKGLFRPAFPQLFNQNTAITYWHRHRFPAQPPEWTLVRYNDDVHLYDMARPRRCPGRASPHSSAAGHSLDLCACKQTPIVN